MVKFVLAVYGSRGDVEPGAAVGVELLRRGHDVAMAVPPDMLGFVGTAGLAAVAYGPDSQGLLHDEDFIGNLSNEDAESAQHSARSHRACEPGMC